MENGMRFIRGIGGLQLTFMIVHASMGGLRGRDWGFPFMGVGVAGVDSGYTIIVRAEWGGRTVDMPLMHDGDYEVVRWAFDNLRAISSARGIREWAESRPQDSTPGTAPDTAPDTTRPNGKFQYHVTFSGECPECGGPLQGDYDKVSGTGVMTGIPCSLCGRVYLFRWRLEKAGGEHGQR